MNLYQRFLFVICSSALLGACANLSSVGTPTYSTKEVLYGAEKCCESLSSLTFKQLPLNQKVRLAVDSNDAVYHYAKDRSSFVEALRLPPNAQSSLLEIESEVVYDRNTKEKQIFFPVLTFLDADKQVIESVEANTVNLQLPLLSKGYMRLLVRLNGKLNEARYLLIHTTEEKLNHAVSKIEGSTLLQTKGFDTMIFAPVGKPRYRINFGLEGWVNVILSHSSGSS